MRPLAITLSMICIACSNSKPADIDGADRPAPMPELVVYSGRSAVLVERLLTDWGTANGVAVKVRFDKSTEALANRLALEGSKSDADLIFAQAVGYLSLLAERDLLRPLPRALLDRVPAKRRDAGGFWVATSGRLRVLVYSPARIAAAELPKTLAELAAPRFAGRVGWAPSNASFHAHLSAIKANWGLARTETWLRAMQANRPAVYPKNSPQVLAVAKGEIDIGWVNHYYLHKLRAEDPSIKAANASFETPGDIGNLVMLAGVGIPKSSDQTALAERLIAFLLSTKAQAFFASKAYEYPSVEGIPLHRDVQPVSGLAAAPQATQNDIAGSLALLRRLHIQ